MDTRGVLIHSRFELQPASPELGQRPVEVGDSVEEYRRVAGQVIGEHQSRPLQSERDLRHARAHRLDGEQDATAKDVAVERDVGLHVAAGHVQNVERLDRHHLILVDRGERGMVRIGFGAL
jgi:hypothetical protein